MSNNKSISVRPETHDRLMAMGRKGESMDSIIQKLLTVYRETQEGKGIQLC